MNCPFDKLQYTELDIVSPEDIADLRRLDLIISDNLRNLREKE
jgi:hypothetical protein